MIWILIIYSILSVGCAHYNKNTNTFYGFGRYKDAEVEMESTLFPLPNLEIDK